MRHTEEASCLLGGRLHGAGLLCAHRHGLLGEHVAAVPQGFEGQLGMGERGGAHCHGIQPLIEEGLPVVGAERYAGRRSPPRRRARGCGRTPPPARRPSRRRIGAGRAIGPPSPLRSPRCVSSSRPHRPPAASASTCPVSRAHTSHECCQRPLPALSGQPIPQSAVGQQRVQPGGELPGVSDRCQQARFAVVDQFAIGGDVRWPARTPRRPWPRGWPAIGPRFGKGG